MAPGATLLSRRRLLTGAVAGVLPLRAPAQSDAADALLRAAARGDLSLVGQLLARGAPLEARDAQERSPLLLATAANHVAVAQLLIDRGASVNAQDQQQDSAFLLAGARGFTAIVRAALAAGADLKSTNRYGGTALIPACHYGHVETVRLLLTTAIDVNHVNRLGWTALLEAVILGDGGPAHTEIVRLLLAHGALPSLADREGVTPLQHALQRQQVRVAHLLRSAGAR
ncbi:MAG: ankyrin repeat domain-containing protein [Rhodoferax sp.]|nr:ankyrin repeat domain-containing protein [Rhodoferax sp.]